MNEATRKENARMLANILGSNEEDALELLDVTAVIRVSPSDAQARFTAAAIQNLLARTLSRVVVNGPAVPAAVEIVIGNADPIGHASRIHVLFQGQSIVINRSAGASGDEEVHPFLCLLAACYACSAAIAGILGSRLKFPTSDPIELSLDSLLGEDASLLGSPCNFGEAFLAGAGAIGNGFVWGLSQLPLRGILHLTDDDHVSKGNMQRCALFTDGDVGRPKAEVLAERGRDSCTGRIVFEPHTMRLQAVPQRRSGPWLRKLVVAVDSPRARRSLQKELPKEVFDASTTGAEEIVLHFNCQPTTNACMACVYAHTPLEDARERHIAESLGVTLAQVKEPRISEASAAAICAKYKQLKPEELVGTAYDTLFKNLCASAVLHTEEGRQALTPFAFVSTLAGLLLALEFLRRSRRGFDGLYNKWSISPWAKPNLRARRILEPDPKCEVCADSTIGPILRAIWAAPN
jgi:hypothetical protein